MKQQTFTITAHRVHPGEILREEFMEPMGLSASQIAKGTGLSRDYVSRLAREEKGMSEDVAIRFARYFGMSDGFWLNVHHSFETAKAISLHSEDHAKVVPLKEQMQTIG